MGKLTAKYSKLEKDSHLRVCFFQKENISHVKKSTSEPQSMVVGRALFIGLAVFW